jgi:hypothetical protein
VFRLTGEHFGYLLDTGHLLRLDGAYVAWLGPAGAIFAAGKRGWLGDWDAGFVLRPKAVASRPTPMVEPSPPVGIRHLPKLPARVTTKMAVGAIDGLIDL